MGPKPSLLVILCFDIRFLLFVLFSKETQKLFFFSSLKNKSCYVINITPQFEKVRNCTPNVPIWLSINFQFFFEKDPK